MSWGSVPFHPVGTFLPEGEKNRFTAENAEGAEERKNCLQPVKNC
jgi:hypothetical protein